MCANGIFLESFGIWKVTSSVAPILQVKKTKSLSETVYSGMQHLERTTLNETQPGADVEYLCFLTNGRVLPSWRGTGLEVCLNGPSH